MKIHKKAVVHSPNDNEGLSISKFVEATDAPFVVVHVEDKCYIGL